jgi:cytidylate kinase
MSIMTDKRLINHIIAVDGPAGVGKGTLCRKLAKTYRMKYLDTGTLYRAIAFKVLEANNNPESEEDAFAATKDFNFDFKHIGNNQFAPFLDGENVATALKQNTIGDAASKVSVFPSVRNAIKDFQTGFISLWQPRTGVIMDGRDMGTVICPEAKMKFFLDADPEVRAQRRLQELKDLGFDADFDVILAQVLERDDRDRNRKVAPLKPAEDAYVIDTSHMNIAEVLKQATEIINKTVK